MHESLMQFLRCPVCGGPLALLLYEASESPGEISSGLLRCSCSAKFPIWRGVPRMLMPRERIIPPPFVAQFSNLLRRDAPELLQTDEPRRQATKFSFDTQWSMYQFGELTWELNLSTRVNYVYQYLDIPRRGLDGKILLDAGCGNGTLSAALAASGARVVALDYSECVERAEVEKHRFAGAAADRLDYVQGDLQHPPFASESFDAVYSDGVLHHTPNTKHSFVAVAPLVKQGGRLFVWLYRSDLKPAYKAKIAAIRLMRAGMRPLPTPIVKALCYIGAVILLTRLRILRLMGMQTRRIIPVWLKALNLHDTLTPRFNHHHIPAEVMSWFQEVGFSRVSETTISSLGQTGFGIVGIRASLGLQPK